MLALAEIVAGGEQEQQRQDIEEGPFHRTFGTGVAGKPGQPPAQQPEAENAKAQGGDGADRRVCGNGGGQQVEDEDQRRIDVDQARVEPLPGQPALAELQHGGGVVVRRGG